MSKQRNYDIDFFKLYYALIIVGYHLLPDRMVAFPGWTPILIRGNSAVTYFLLISGMFLFRNYERNKNGRLTTPNRFFVTRFWRFFPAMLVSYVFAFIVFRVIVMPVESPSQLMDFLASDLWELMLVKMNGMNGDALFFNTPAWTVSSIFLVGCAFWCFLYTCPRAFLNLILPISLILAFGAYLHQPSQSHEMWNGITTSGTLRAWMMMGLGYYAGLLTRFLAGLRFNKTGCALLTAFEVFCHVFVLWSVNSRTIASFEWCNTLAFALSAAIALSGHSYITKLLSGFGPARYFGEFSLSIYLVQRAAIRLAAHIWGYYGCLDHIPAFAAMLVAFALLHLLLTRLFIRASHALHRLGREKLLEHPAA